MSERFDDLLSGVVDTASRAARDPSADAARKRGRQRRTRQRLAATTLSVALLGGVGGIAAVSANHSNGVPAAHATQTVSAPASPSPSVTTSPTGTPSTSPSTTAGSPAGSSSSAQSTVTETSPSTVPSPGGYVAGAWLGASQMPLSLAGYTDWQVDTNVGGTHLGAEVFGTAAAQSATGCMDIGLGGLSSLSNGLEGAQIEMFSGSNSDKIRADGIIPAYAHQVALFYPNTADADAAMNGLATDYATCKNQVTGTDPTTGTKLVGSIQQTTDQTGAQCWTVLALGATSGPGTLDHDCFVQSGNIIELVNVEVNEVPSLSTQSFTTSDTNLIPELQHDLQQY